MDHGRIMCNEEAQASAAVSAAREAKERRPSAISLLNWGGRVCRLTAERYRQRKQLMQMDYLQLKDIGITPAEAEQEARKPIWKD